MYLPNNNSTFFIKKQKGRSRGLYLIVLQVVLLAYFETRL